MANERKTEIITRDHFSKFLDSIYIEEQRSDNPKIDKLLKSASKKGGFSIFSGGRENYLMTIFFKISLFEVCTLTI